MSSPKGSIISPHYPQPYGRNADCMWKVSGPAGSRMQVVIMDLDLESHHTCNFDYIEVNTDSVFRLIIINLDIMTLGVFGLAL